MDGMFSRLNQPMYEADKLEILLHNIRPCFSTIIAASNVGTVDDLKIACKNYERIKVRSDNFKEPPSASSGTLAPEFSFIKRKEVPKTGNNTNNNNFDRSSSEWNDWLLFLNFFITNYSVSAIFNTKPSGDPRPYVKVRIGDLSLYGLLDSGSAVTILGNNSHRRLINHNLNLCMRISSLGYILLPVVFEKKFFLIKAHVIPEIETTLILGIDFWSNFSLCPKYLSNTDNLFRYSLRRKDAEFNVGDIVWKRFYFQSDKDAYFCKKLAPKFIKCK
ncbi:hypothetical protein OBRU01_25689, partial [Operophtera brumata]